MELIHRFVHLGPGGPGKKEEAALTVEKLWGDVYYLDRFTPSKNLGVVAPEVWISLFKEAIDFGRRLQAKEFQFRTVSDQDSTSFIKWIAQVGSQKKQDRIEFRAAMDELVQRGLTDELASPMTWSSVESLDLESLKRVGELIHQVGVGDPDYDLKDDPVALLKSYLGDPVLTSGRQCIHLGSVKGKWMSLVIAQVNPKTGWSRITYMGMIPEFRGQGLGKWVHRHGFKMMKEQGGKLYQGGTALTNERMIKLFRESGCKEYRRMQEWSYKF